MGAGLGVWELGGYLLSRLRRENARVCSRDRALGPLALRIMGAGFVWILVWAVGR